MGKIVRAEWAKVWHNKIFILTILLLVFVNSLLLVREFYAQNIGIPASAYKKITGELSTIAPEERLFALQEKHDTILAIWQIDEFAKQEYYLENPELAKEWEKKNAAILEKYGALYASRDYLHYTDTLQSEYFLLSELVSECRDVTGYETFLSDVQKTSAKLESVSIFSDSADGYDIRNIEKTAAAYAGIHTIKIDYFPQRGLTTALTFVSTDVIFIVCIILLAFFIIREEKEKGLLAFIKTTYKGYFPTILSKIIVLAISQLLILAILYGTNLLLSSSVAGLGNMFRSIQSVLLFKRSLLTLNVATYVFVFLITKWVAVFVIGLWVLCAALLAKTTLSSVLFSSSIIAVNLFIYALIPATSYLNVIKYFNLISLLNTNEILGSYRNIYWFGSPISLVQVTALAAVFFFLFFFLLVVYIFCYSTYPEARKEASSSVVMTYLWIRVTGFKKKTVFKFEMIKHYILNGVLLLFLLFVGLQIYNFINQPSFVTAEEIIYKQYLTKLQGRYSESTRNNIISEFELFAEKENNATFTFGDVRKRDILEKIVTNNLAYVATTANAYLLYDTGYSILFGIIGSRDFWDSLYACVLCILSFSMLFTFENKYSITKLLSTTHAGLRRIAQEKFKISSLTSLAICLAVTLPCSFEVAKNYGLPGIFYPAVSLPFFSHYPKFVPIICVLFFLFLARFLVINSCARIISFLTFRCNSFIESFSIAFVVFALPILLSLIGLPQIEWLSIYPVFHAAAISSVSIANIIGTILFLFCWYGAGLLCKNHVIEHFGTMNIR